MKARATERRGGHNSRPPSPPHPNHPEGACRMHLLAPDSSAHFDGDPSHAHLPLTQRPFVQNVLPWLASVALHGALIIFGIATYTVVKSFAPTVRPQIVVPDIGDTATLDKLKG